MYPKPVAYSVGRLYNKDMYCIRKCYLSKDSKNELVWRTKILVQGGAEAMYRQIQQMQNEASTTMYGVFPGIRRGGYVKPNQYTSIWDLAKLMEDQALLGYLFSGEVHE